MTDYYHCLGLSRDATGEQIRRNYHQLALEFHPDRAGAEGAERFKEIQSAYEVLSNPKKREIYDKFGAAALDNPFSDALMVQIGGFVIFCVMAVLVFILASMVVVFTAFIVSYVDGRLAARGVATVNDHSRSYWNYVKVFSPLFVVDIIVGVPALIGLIVAIVSFRIDAFFWTLLVLSLILISILVPVAKDANDKTALRGGNDFYLWRRWLAPLYIAVALYTLLCFITRLPTRRRYKSLKSNGNEGLWGYMKLSFFLALLRGLSLAAFSALIALRADEVITANYFVVLALPFYVFGALLLLEAVAYQISIQRVRGVSRSCCYNLVNFTALSTVLILALASISLVSKRLNDLDSVRHGNTGKVMSLALALVPAFVLLGSPSLRCCSFCAPCVGCGFRWAPAGATLPRVKDRGKTRNIKRVRQFPAANTGLGVKMVRMGRRGENVFLSKKAAGMTVDPVACSIGGTTRRRAATARAARLPATRGGSRMLTKPPASPAGLQRGGGGCKGQCEVLGGQGWSRSEQSVMPVFFFAFLCCVLFSSVMIACQG
ncbi:putative DnaJ chaperone protein [Trypanosoma conorhini]|uniref:Putative DnaJ chaperone protein n=1 Tax=Trypanosoma conorhini TaxID=83891 RepID=A0A3R7L019_9TRYP|nr:putative DnaJ chaperone protein [Trypanosoma conorhini]RNF16925.1 putative DnaJ chaperone protein [Trypanosoma conorhini]